MRYPSHTNKALRNFFLFSMAFHLILFLFLGQILHTPKTDYRIEVDIKILAPKRVMRNIPLPKKHLNDIHHPPLLKSEIFPMPKIIHMQKDIPKVRIDDYSINHKKLEILPESVLYEVTPVHTIVEGIKSISMPQLPLVLSPASSDIDQTHIYKAQILSHIKKHRKYPLAAQRRGIKGSVSLDFLLYSDGTLGDIKVTKKSKYQILNSAAIESIIAGEPFPPFPPGMKEESILIGVPITFDLVEKTALN